MFPDFSWAGNFAFGIAAAAFDGFSPVPCTRDIWKFLTILQWLLSTELKLLDSGNEWWTSAFNRRKCTFLASDGLKENLNAQVPGKKTTNSNQQPILLNSSISTPVSHLEALSHDFKVSISCSLQHLTDCPCRTPQHVPYKRSRAEQELWGGWHYMAEHGTWHSSALSFLRDIPDYSLKPASLTEAPQEYTTDFGTTAVKSWSAVLMGAFPSLCWGKNTRQSQTKLLFIASALQVTHAHAHAGTHRHSPARAFPVCTQTSTAPGKEGRKGPHNCHLSIFIKNLP